MTPDTTLERDSTNADAHSRIVAGEPGRGTGNRIVAGQPGRIVRPTPRRNTTLLVALLGLGALWLWSRPQAEPRPQRPAGHAAW